MKKKKILKIVLVIVLVIGIIAACIIKYYLIINEDVVITDGNIIKEEIKEEKKTEEKVLKVDIKGEINNPGVYDVMNENRVIDVINMAGGLKVTADTSLINLSKKVSDEMVIIIYSKEEVANSNVVKTVVKEIDGECVCPNIQNDGCINTDIAQNITDDSNDIININTASLEELQKLDGVGESKAKKIIEYRQKNGSFKNIEDIMEVSGIGQSMFDKIKDSITV